MVWQKAYDGRHLSAVGGLMVEFKRKPRKCPQCGSVKVATILRGMPTFSEKLMTDISEGKVVLGGCCITENDPSWQCNECHMQFFKTNESFEGG